MAGQDWGREKRIQATSENRKKKELAVGGSHWQSLGINPRTLGFSHQCCNTVLQPDNHQPSQFSAQDNHQPSLCTGGTECLSCIPNSHWRIKPGVLGSTPGNCQLFTRFYFRLITSKKSSTSNVDSAIAGAAVCMGLGETVAYNCNWTATSRASGMASCPSGADTA